MGGFVGLRLAIRRPELLRSLTLIDTSADPETRENAPKYKLLNLVARWIGPWAVADRIMPIMFSRGFLNDAKRSELRRRWRKYLVDNDRVGVSRAIQGVIMRDGVYEQLDEIRIPTLILVGEEDVATTPEKAGRMHERISGSRLVAIPRAGHMTPVEEPEAVTKALKEFLEGLS